MAKECQSILTKKISNEEKVLLEELNPVSTKVSRIE
jgi:hypothetical protein